MRKALPLIASASKADGWVTAFFRLINADYRIDPALFRARNTPETVLRQRRFRRLLSEASRYSPSDGA